jgi:hypothetical protein
LNEYGRSIYHNISISSQGEFEYPDPSKWTNEELGIPPDSYEG